MGTSEILPVSGPSGSCVALAGPLGNRKSPRKPEEALFGAPQGNVTSAHNAEMLAWSKDAGKSCQGAESRVLRLSSGF